MEQSLSGLLSSLAATQPDDTSGDYIIANSDIPSIIYIDQPMDSFLQVKSAAGEDDTHRLEEALCFATATSVFEDEPASPVIKQSMVSSESIRDHLDAMVNLGLLQPEARVPVYNEMASQLMSSIGEHVGCVMRTDRPGVQGGVHPLIANSTPLDKIPKRILKNVDAVWDTLPEKEKQTYGSKELLTQALWHSAHDHLFVALNNPLHSTTMVLGRHSSRPAQLLPVEISDNQQPILGHSSFLCSLNTVGIKAFKTDGEEANHLSIQASFSMVSMKALVNIYVPVLSIFALMVADWFSKNQSSVKPTSISITLILDSFYYGGSASAGSHEELLRLAEEAKFKHVPITFPESFDLLSADMTDLAGIVKS